MHIQKQPTTDSDREKEVKLFKQAQQGCRASLDQLMDRHEGLVQANVRRQWPGPVPFEERVQAGRMGLWRAIMGYNPDRGLAFSTYAWPSISRHIWRLVQVAERCEQKAVSLPWPEAESDPALEWEAQAVQETVHQLVARLPQRQRQIILARYGLTGQEPALFRQIGPQLGLSAERVRQLHLDALIWLRHPGHSHQLRALLGRQSVADYEHAFEQARTWRRYRRPKRGQDDD